MDISYIENILFNLSKYKNVYLLPLKKLINKIYGKKIVFNIILLKNFYLDNNISTQIIATKAKKRKNRIIRVLRVALDKIKTPIFSKNFLSRERKLLTVNNYYSLKDNSNIDKLISKIYYFKYI